MSVICAIKMNCKCDLPADERVNVLRHVLMSDLSLLDQICKGQKIVFRSVNEQK